MAMYTYIDYKSLIFCIFYFKHQDLSYELFDCAFFLYCSRAFDVDLLYIAQYFNIPLGEVAISWQEIEGKNYKTQVEFGVI